MVCLVQFIYICIYIYYITVHGILQARILKWVAYPSPVDLPDPGIEPESPALQADSLPAELPGKPMCKVKMSSLGMLSKLGCLQFKIECYKCKIFYINLMVTTGEGNGTLPQYSCLENPMDGGA